MSVLLVFDQYGIDDSPAIVATRDQLQALRERIDQHLRGGETGCLRIRLKSEYRPRFADFIGLRGVDCLDIEPRTAFAQHFGVAAPDWAADAALAKLLTLPPPKLSEQEDATAWILGLVDMALVRPENWLAFCAALADPLWVELAWLGIEPVKQRLGQSAAQFLPIEAASWFIGRIAEFATPVEALAYLSRQRLGEHLRSFVLRHALEYSLPARAESSPFLNDLPLWSVTESAIDEKWLADWLGVLDNAVQAATMQSLAAAGLAELAVIGWPRWIAALKAHLTEHRQLATAELAAALEELGGSAADLAADLREQLTACDSLPEHADIETARDWLQGYLNYALRRFMAEQEPEEAVSMSFSAWVLRQQARISRAEESNWRYASGTVEKHLRAPDTRVIVCMVDALSALYNPLVRDMAQGLVNGSDLAVEENFLIAPYPSLTEIGKNAVLTGKPSEQTSGSVDNRLYQAFRSVLASPEEICVLKSWEQRNQPIPKNTRLLVYLENRIDERLHSCVSYAKFHSEVTAIIKQLGKELKQWLAQSRKQGFEPVALITADHGVSYIRALNSSNSDLLGDYGERSISFPTRPPPQEGFAITEAAGSHYLLPMRRVRLQGDMPLTHGGLTPEELLIPCVILRRPYANIPAQAPLHIQLHKTKAITVTDGWQLHLILESRCAAHTVKLEAKPPFRGRYGPCGPLQTGGRVEVLLTLQADCPQEGLTRVELTATFSRPDWHSTETLFCELDVLFPPRLLEKTAVVDNFENMF